MYLHNSLGVDQAAPPACCQCNTAQNSRSDRRHAAHQQTPAAQADRQHAVKRGVFRGVGVFVVEVVQSAHKVIIGLVGKVMPDDREVS